MARYFFANTLAGLQRSAYVCLDGVTGAGRFNSSYVSSCISVPSQNGSGGGTFIQTMPFIDASSTTTLWTHFDGNIASATTTADYHFMQFINSSGVVVFRITSGTASQTLRCQYWNGTTYVALGTNFSYPFGSLAQWDIKLTAGASGTVDIYWNGGLGVSLSGMNAAVDNFAAVRWSSPTSSGTSWFSQIMGADFDTRDSRLVTLLANANGTHTDGTGSYTDINEVVLDDSTGISLPAVGDKKTFTKAALTLPSGYSHCMCVVVRGRAGGGVVADGKIIIRSGGTDYLSSNKSFNGGYEGRGHYLELDPATGVAWTQTGFDNAEFGLQAT